MAANEPEEPIVQEVEQDFKQIRLLQRLLLVDVFPLQRIQAGLLLGGQQCCWLASWSITGSRAGAISMRSISACQPGDRGLRGPDAHHAVGEVIHHHLSDQSIGILLALFDRIRVVRARAIENPRSASVSPDHRATRISTPRMTDDDRFCGTARHLSPGL